MFTKISAKLLLLLLLSNISMAAPAQASSDPTAANSAQQFSEPENAIREEIKLFTSARISMLDAIEIVEKRATGAKAVDVSFDGKANQFAYRVKTYRRSEIWEETVDASTGRIGREEFVTPVSKLDSKDRTELANFRAAGIDLSDVVPIAEKYGSGKAISAGLEEKNGRLIFLVVLVADGSLKQISVDPNQYLSRPRKAPDGGSRR